MGVKIAATGLAIVLAGGALYSEVQSTNEIPSVLLKPAAGALPNELPAAPETRIYAADTTTYTAANALGILAGRNQIVVSLKNISPFVQESVIDAEDERFRQHNGCDVQGISRAAKVNFFRLAKNKLGLSKKPVNLQGGSTIDGQVSGLIYPKATNQELANGQIAVQKAYEISPELAQQAYECTLALKMNQVYGKDLILEKYLNNAYFGRGATGVEAAAQAYFGISAKDLNLQQSIVLAATLTRPSDMDVDVTNDKDPAQAKRLLTEYNRLTARSNRIIDTMVRLGHIEPEQATTLKNTEIVLIPFSPKPNGNKSDNARRLNALHYLTMVKKEAAEKLNIELGRLSNGYIIHTTLNTVEQKALKDSISSVKQIGQNGIAAAGVSLSNSNAGNAVTAMIGNTTDSQVNIAIGRGGGGGGRDGGSIIKGFAFAEGYKVGMPVNSAGKIEIPASVVIPQGDDGKDWVIDTGNGCDKLRKSVPCEQTPEEALAVSSNIATGKILNKVGGIEPIAENMVALGVDLPKPYFASNVIGTGAVSPLGVATGYSNLVLGRGEALPNYTVTKITDTSGKTTFYERQPVTGKQVYSEEVALQATKAMVEVYQQGTAKGKANDVMLKRNSVAGKTGTGNDATDLWASTIFKRKSDGGRTVAIWAGNPNKKVRVEGLTSADMAGIGTSFAQKITAPDDFSDITG